MEGKTFEAAAGAAGMSDRTARKWASGPLPSQTKRPRDWRTPQDPFTEVWASEVEPLLAADEDRALEAKTVLADLMRRYPERFEVGQLRTLQRRFRDWRAQHVRRRRCSSRRCTHRGGSGRSTSRTRPSSARRLRARSSRTCSPPRDAVQRVHFVELAFSETFEPLTRALQNALVALGGVPLRLRSDNLSAATQS